MKKPQPPSDAAQLSAVVTTHCADKGYAVAGPETDKYGYLNFQVTTADQGARTGISFNGEVFILSFPAGYGWTEFAQTPEERPEALATVLSFLDAYADPATREVEVKRRLRRPRLELHVSNGAVLRRRGLSRGPLETP
ncbi:hypothetical protein [Intrasporangium calvum]|uniref:hypothetical protein n=1 Tax=Intrasporangium calvum TaxID=53358 RepID=UPI000DF6427A|nr:hypothetical protein [Intrasporangium calvum]AXG12099.1 hypothetical protein DN585_00370 [Intrasporangium calvum]